MQYQHRFLVKAPLDSVSAFHSRASSMAAITPPPVFLRIHEAPDILRPKDVIHFTLWLGPLPIRWRVIIENITAAGFVDRQLEGPFQYWIHSHQFTAVDNHTTAVDDQIQLAIRKNAFWGLVGLLFYVSLPALFAYRGWKTRRLLERDSA
jgi:ligand-binding SRPBCC domain-containing protein